jgi:hypothetical protein
MSSFPAWLAAVASTVAALVAVLTYRKVHLNSSVARWEGPIERGGGVLCLRNAGPAAARDVRVMVSKDAFRISDPPGGDFHDVVHADAYVEVGRFAERSFFVSGGFIEVTWKDGRRGVQSWKTLRV